MLKCCSHALAPSRPLTLAPLLLEWKSHLVKILMPDIFTARKRSLGRGNVFTPVCNSDHEGGVSVPAYTTGHMTRGGGLCLGGVSVRETSVSKYMYEKKKLSRLGKLFVPNVKRLENRNTGRYLLNCIYT